MLIWILRKGCFERRDVVKGRRVSTKPCKIWTKKVYLGGCCLSAASQAVFNSVYQIWDGSRELSDIRALFTRLSCLSRLSPRTVGTSGLQGACSGDRGNKWALELVPGQSKESVNRAARRVKHYTWIDNSAHLAMAQLLLAAILFSGLATGVFSQSDLNEGTRRRRHCFLPAKV
jgi:hypothetical protein